LHGLTATQRYWLQNIEALAARRRVIALDLPGFGRSQPDVDYSIDYFVRALMRVLDEKVIARAALIGNSMGGHIAMATALQHPIRVDKLVLVDPAGVTAVPLWLLRVASWLALSAAGLVERAPPRVAAPVRAGALYRRVPDATGPDSALRALLCARHRLARVSAAPTRGRARGPRRDAHADAGALARVHAAHADHLGRSGAAPARA
jgi:pimeloyl-ACP methyl ester carboxylesterase